MNKKILTLTFILTFLLSVSLAYAEDADPVSEMPIDQGIVIDVSGGNTANTTTEQVDINSLVTEQAEDEAAANDGTVLPLDQGNVDATDIDSGTVDIEGPQPEVTVPEQDTVVLTEKEPVVEPLAQTGIKDNTVLYAGVFGLLGLIGFIAARRMKLNSIED